MTHEEPQTLPDEIANAALEGALACAREKGVEVEHVFVTLNIKDAPDELDASSSGYGFEDGLDLLGELLSAAKSLSRQLGVKLELIYPQMN